MIFTRSNITYLHFIFYVKSLISAFILSTYLNINNSQISYLNFDFHVSKNPLLNNL